MKQIQIAESHAAGVDLAELVAGYNGNDGLTQAHLLPYGLRTVDGSYNNLLPGRENWGASDQSFPGLFDPTYMNDADGDRYDFNPLPNMQTWYTNNDYANAGPRTGSQPGPGSGTVIDADPRIISNLIVDQTLNNPAAIAAALTHAGLSGQPLMNALSAIVAAKAALDAAIDAAEAAEGLIAGLQANVDAAELALANATAAASAAMAQAAADLAAFETAEALVAPAAAARDAALLAYTTLLTDATPNNEELAEIAEALAAFEAAQADYALVQANADALEATADASAGLAADASALAVAAQATLTQAEADLAEAAAVTAEVVAATTALDGLLATHGVEMDGNTVYLPNVSPDEGLSSPFNGWMTIFGQFFDHGLDLVAKGGNGTVYVPLSPDDPLYVEGGQNYIPLTRVTVNPGDDGVLGTADDGPGPKNLTTPWVDQNQTYGSTASKQVFMREYIPGPDGKPVASGLLLEGSNGGLATWADIKAQARDVLGIELTDLNVGNIPLIAADEYGNFIPGANGYPQLVVGMGPDGQLGTADDVLREGNPAAPVSAQGVVLTGHAFLDDIAHAAVPIVTGGVLMADTDSALGYANSDGSPGPQGQRGPTAYDNELLDRHFIAGDGRANENIALTAVHQVFHAEHNRIVEHTKDVVLQSGDLAFLNEWLLVDVAAVPTTDDAINALVWDGERLFQAGRFTNEMEYQHLVFEEFGRMMQPDIDAFVFEPSADINPSIAAEFAHVVYRFGHSMLRQDIAVIEMDANGNPVQNDITLFDGFLNPVMYDSLGSAEQASGAIIRGMSRQAGSEIDEFVTDVLRNQLLGIPLDLATINIARGRDVGTPPLNAAREKFFAATGDTLLKPYESWADFALNMKNPASIINFIAAYGTHASLLNNEANPKTIEQLREAATKLVLGDNTLTGQEKIDFDNDRLDFLNATGAYEDDDMLGGLNTVDFWMGGLAEKKMAFGGMLGSTFSFVFQMTMENLQDADRFYYLSRTQGLNLLNELENNTFAELVMRNTDLGDDEQTALPGNLFSAFQMPTLEMDISKQLGADPVSDDPFLGGFSQLVERVDANNDGIAEYIRVNSNEHFTIGGTEGNDTIVSGGGDDAIWGRGGNDRIEAGYGVDKVFGGEGDDIITNAGTDIGEADFLHGNEGNDVIHGGSGLSLLFGNQGNDFIVTGPDGKEAFGGTGNDFILGGTGGDFLLGNEGDDWIEGGQRFDTLSGENSELFFNSSIIGHDVLNGGSGDTDYDGESGDDIMFQNSEGIQRSNGMAGFDWAIHKGDSQAAVSDLGIPLFETQEAFILRDRFDLVEGLSGWDKNDTLTGRSVAVNTRAEATGTAAIPNNDSALDSYSNALLEKNVDLITGLRALVAHITRTTQIGENGVSEQVVMDTADASDIILGGGGSDRIKGLAGNDVIDGDMWLNVRVLVTPVVGQTWAAFSVDSLTELAPRMLSGEINPSQLSIVREIVDGKVAGDIDTAVYTDVRANYSFGLNSDGSLFVDHTGFVQPQADDDLPEEEALVNPRSDGRDTVRGIEKLEFTDGTLNVIMGTPFNDNGQPGVANRPVLNGTAQDDLIVGLAGSDILNGNGGNDILLGSAGSDALNGGLGNDTYMFGLADGTDTIIDAGGTDRISITAGTLSGLNGFEVTQGAGNDDLTIQFNGQQITIVDHFDQAVEAVEFINFNGGTYEGYELAGDYVLGTDDNGTRSAATGDNTLLAGTTASDDLAGGDGADLLFGHSGNDDLDGGAGDDLLVGGAGTDELNGGLGSDTMIGGGDSDLYVVDDADDVVIEAIGGGTADEVETTLAAYTLGANVENLTYAGAGTFTATGNELANRIEGGAGIDTLSGLGGNDTYVVTAGDIIIEAVGGGTDTVSSAASYTLGANLENLTLTGGGDIDGTGNELANTITGNDDDNQLFGGAGDDTLTGNDGNDLLDGGTGNDTLNGGDDNDTIIGGAGNDTIDVGGGFNTVVYNATGFGSDVVNSFDANAANGGQDRIDLSGLGITAATFASRVTLANVAGNAVLATVLNADGSLAGTIRINAASVTNGNNNQVTVADFILASTTAPVGGATNGNNTLTGTNGNNTFIGLQGTDTIFGLGGDDTIIWNANATGPTDGRDIVNGGTEGTLGDTFVVNGNASMEAYTIYTRAAWDAIPGNNGNSPLAAATEIVITRNGSNFANVIAELSEIEEIRINGFDPSGTGTAGGDTFQVIGDFSGTSLRLNTITIDGNAGDDTVDISALSSAHRIVFRSNGGNDTIVGTLRPQDVIELPDGAVPEDYTSTTDESGVTTMTNGTHSICFTAPDGPPQVGHGDDDDHHDEDDEDDDCGCDDDDDETGTPAPSPSGGATRVGTVSGDTLLGTAGADNIIGLAGDDVLIGDGGDDAISAGEGADFVDGGAGRDSILAGAGDDTVFAGADADLIHGEVGADRIFGQGGDDVIFAGAGNDTVVGGAGNDLFVAGQYDDHDVYFGDEIGGGNGVDTLDLSAITANLTVDLGNGVLGRGSAVSNESGDDTLWSIENVATGSGNDTITASAAVNVMQGGAGDDTFRFLDAAGADGDTILDFEPGDRLDVSGIDANSAVAGNQSFTLIPGTAFTGPGQLMVSYETRDGVDYTIVSGNISGADGEEFRIDLKGSHNLNGGNFSL
ncbi:MAG TPA: peroxidase family protein [Bosea sp. (in: a-proteobacteria)]|uniref:peroxidase family protein n=1 Tax=Bosea sp. (in: a-proteobacteria) TaxID=1871050 RepID=UPI002E11D59B|nr:peroxidase family protein [Bosea sp. (in: a-proteobacteria)]